MITYAIEPAVRLRILTQHEFARLSDYLFHREIPHRQISPGTKPATSRRAPAGVQLLTLAVIGQAAWLAWMAER